MGVIMTINVDDKKINCIQYGKGEDIVLLHGWGQNIEMMNPLGKKLENKYRITIIDLPGHGLSMEPNDDTTIYDYADTVKKVLDELNIENPSIIGHSFGGRIAIIYASKYKVNKLILFGAPCIRQNNNISLKVKMLKKLKKVPGLNHFEEFAKKHIGSRDYKNAGVTMRKILVNTVNEDLTDCAKKIECPTLLIWGDNDTESPLEEARILEKIMKDAALIVYESGTHYAYLEFINPISRVIKSFI